MRCLSALALLLLCLTSPAHGSDGQFPGLQAAEMNESVFNRQVMVYHGGREEGVPVVLVHGLGADASRMWRGTVDALKAHHPVIVLDLPGFGASSRANELYSPDNYARVLHEVIQTFADGPVLLVGHSMGGAISLRYAGRYPERVQTLHLISVAGVLHRSAYAAFLTRVGDADGRVDGRGSANNPVDRAVGDAIRKFVRRTPDVDFLLSSAFFRQTVLGGEPEQIAALALVAEDFGSSLDQVRAPTRIYWGEEDRVAALRTGEILAARLPEATLTVFPEVGHVPMLAIPEQFHEVLLAGLVARDRREGDDTGAHQSPGKEEAVCRGQRGYTLTGAFDRIVIENCTRVLLSEVAAREVIIRDSRVRMRNVRLDADPASETPVLQVRNSELLITAGHFSGARLIETERSVIDMAGTVLDSEGPALRNVGPHASEVIFSVTTQYRGNRRRYLHDVMAFEEGDGL